MKKNLFQIRFGYAKIHNSLPAKSVQKQIDITTVQKTGGVISLLQFPYIRQTGRVKISPDRNPFCVCTCQFLHTSGSYNSALPYNRSPAAKALDFGEDM